MHTAQYPRLLNNGFGLFNRRSLLFSCRATMPTHLLLTSGQARRTPGHRSDSERSHQLRSQSWSFFPTASKRTRSAYSSSAPRSCVTRTIVFPSARKRSNVVEALLLEALVADGENLVEQQDVEVDLDRDRVGEPNLHSRREVLQLLVHEALELRERDDLVVTRSRALVGDRPSSVPLMRMLSRAVSSGLKPTPSSMNGERSPSTVTVAAVLPVDAGHDLQERALAAAVRRR